MADRTPRKSATAGGNRARGKHSGASSAPKVLRIGIIQSGKIVEERIVRKRESVLVGPSEKNNFVLPQEDVPASRFCLFETRGPGTPYVLNFLSNMEGKLSLKGEVVELSEALRRGKARKKSRHYQLLLNEDARGKVVLGNSTVLFQFVPPPPLQPKPQLPAAVKGSPFQGIELVISISMVVSFLFHLAMVMHFQLTDWPEKTLAEKHADLMKLLSANTASFEEKKKGEKKSEEGEGDEEEFEEEEEEESKPDKKSKDNEEEDAGPKKSAEQIAQERADRRAALAQQIAQQGINKILGTIGGEGQGAVADVLSGGDVAADQDDLLDQVNGVGVASGDGDSRLKGPAGGSGTGEEDLEQIRASGGDKNVRTSGPGPEKSVKGLMKKKAPTASGGSGMMSPADVAKVVNKRLGAIKGCYERALKRDPTLSGRITIRFTISGSGRVTSAKATTNQLNSAVGSCITDSFKRFRFPPPEGGEVTFEYPFMFAPAN